MGSAANSLDGFNTVTLNTGGGADTLNFNDQGDTSANIYTLSSSSMQRTIGVVVNYSNIESLTLNAGISNDNITLLNSSVQAPVQINTGVELITPSPSPAQVIRSITCKAC